jgi:integrase
MISAKSDRIPRSSQHKASGQAVVRLNGRDIYLGQYGTPEARAKYERTISEWLSAGRQLPQSGRRKINDLILAFWHHCEQHYRKPDGRPTSELGLIRLALRPLREIYGLTFADAFGPLALKAVRQRMMDGGMSRGVINAHVGRIRRMFRWGVENELVPPAIHQALQAVAGLQRGRSEARETKPTRPAPQTDVDAVLPLVARQIAAMIQLQLRTGCRPGEACDLRGCDIDTAGRTWVFRPGEHKTEHRGRTREIFIGPRAKRLLRPWLKREPTAFLFSPKEAEAARNADRRANRQSPMTPSQSKRRPKTKRRRPARERYDVASYRRAIKRACEVAGVPVWHPHQLRHNAGTQLRKEFGVEVARIILGHSTAFTTEIYAEADREEAKRAMVKVG